MACFLVPTSVAIVTTLTHSNAKGKEWANKWKLNWLNTMLWGGVILLAVEHVAHGEVTAWPPFLTAMSNPADTAVMLHEMATVGTAMTVAIVCVWLAMVALAPIVSRIRSKHAHAVMQ